MIKKYFLLLLTPLLFFSCRSFFKKAEQFRVVKITTRDLVKYSEANGSIEAINAVDVISPISGRLEKLFVKEGDFVKARQQIGLVSSDARSLFLDMASTKSKKELEYWKRQIQLTPILAPSSGKIISLKADLDDKVSGAIAQISKGEVVRANVDEVDLPNIKIGQNVVIRFDISSEAVLYGKLEKISETSKLVNNVNVYQIEVSLPSLEEQKKIPFPVKIGMSVTLSFTVHEKKQTLCLPLDVVNGKSQTNVVLIREDNQKTKVQLGDAYGDWVEVLSGLSDGDKIKVPKFKLQPQKSRKSPLMIKKD